MSAEYQSFLICFHPGHTDVFRNGLPLGVVKDGVFQIHHHTRPDGAKMPVEIPLLLPVMVEDVVHQLIEARMLLEVKT